MNDDASHDAPPNPPPASVDRLQRWFQAVIRHPHSIEAGLRDDAAGQHIRVTPENVEQVVTRSEALSALDRLAIYGYAYHERLRECLRAEFPALLHALGDELFDLFSFNYLQHYPSRSYTLNRLGEHFPRYLAESRADWQNPADRDAERWPEFIINLALLERTFSEVFDGPGAEKRPILTAARLAEIQPGARSDVRLEPVVCLRLLALRFPVHDYLTAARRGDDPPLPPPRDTLVAVNRRDYVVEIHELSRPQFALLRGLSDGQALGAAARFAANLLDQDAAAVAADAWSWLEDWTPAGFFASLER